MIFDDKPRAPSAFVPNERFAVRIIWRCRIKAKQAPGAINVTAELLSLAEDCRNHGEGFPPDGDTGRV